MTPAPEQVDVRITLPPRLDQQVRALAEADRHRVETEIRLLIAAWVRQHKRQEARETVVVETIYDTDGEGALVDAIAHILAEVQANSASA